MANLEILSKILEKVSKVLQDKEMSEEFFEIYNEELKDIDDETLILSAKECLRTLRFFPSIAELREKASVINEKEKNRRMLATERTCSGVIGENGFCDMRNGCSYLFQEKCKERWDSDNNVIKPKQLQRGN